MVSSHSIMSYQSVALICCLSVISSSSQTSTVTLSTRTPKVNDHEEKVPWWVFRSSERPKWGKGKDKSHTLSYIIYNPTSSKFEDKLLVSLSTINTSTNTIADGPSGLEGAGGNHPLAILSYILLPNLRHPLLPHAQATTSVCSSASSIIVVMVISSI